ncbi:MAG: LysR family transcriptional regulator, partial [Alphaproteobacteria bacterium]
NITLAGERLGLSQSSVSRHVRLLEQDLNAPLFHRLSHGVVLTEQGELLYQTTRQMDDALAFTEASLSHRKKTPEGPLRIMSTITFGSIWLAPRLKRFLKEYPDIDVSLTVQNYDADLSVREADAAIRISPPRQSNVIQRHLATLRVHLYASRDYVKQNGVPTNATELKNHKLILYNEDYPAFQGNLNFLLDVAEIDLQHSAVVLKINHANSLFLAMKSGIGIAGLSDYMVAGDSDIVPILPEIEGPAFEAYLVYPEKLRDSKRIRAFWDFLVSEVQKSGL